jgi:hypothetical protein
LAHKERSFYHLRKVFVNSAIFPDFPERLPAGQANTY